MPDNIQTLPEQIVEASRAFTQTLEMENAVLTSQINGIIKTTTDALHQLIELCKDAITVGNCTVDAATQHALTGVIQKALADVQQTTAQAGGSAAAMLPEIAAGKTATGQDLDPVLVHAVGLSYQNAVTAQQQVNITQQAAATMTISTILSLVTATLGVAVKKAEG